MLGEDGQTYPAIYDRVRTQLSSAIKESVGGAGDKQNLALRLTSKGGVVDELLETHGDGDMVRYDPQSCM